MTDQERIEDIRVATARIEVHVEYLVDQSKQQDDLTAALANRMMAVETEVETAKQSRRRLRASAFFVAAIVLTFVIERALTVIF